MWAYMLRITGSKWSARLEFYDWDFLQPFSAKIIILSETWSDTFMLLYSNLGWQIACKSLNSKHGIDCESLEIRCYFVINWLSARSLARSLVRPLSLSFLSWAFCWWIVICIDVGCSRTHRMSIQNDTFRDVSSRCVFFLSNFTTI